MKTTTCIIWAFLISSNLLCLCASAQTTHAIYLKNGKAIYGNYTTNFDKKIVTIQLAKDSSIIVPLDSVSSIQTDPAVKTEKRTAYGVVKVGINSLNASLGASISAGFWLSRNVKVGAGLELYKSLAPQEPQKIYLTEYMPVFAELRCEFPKAKATPFIMLQGGFGFVVRNQLDYFELNNTGIITRMKEGGGFGGVYAGFKYKFKNGLHWFWEGGFKLQGYTTQTTMYTNGIRNYDAKTENIVYLNVNIGLMW